MPNPPGGGTDLVARITAQKVSERWGSNIIVDNRPGAGGIIAVEVAAKAAPDGYTLRCLEPFEPSKLVVRINLKNSRSSKVLKA